MTNDVTLTDAGILQTLRGAQAEIIAGDLGRAETRLDNFRRLQRRNSQRTSGLLEHVDRRVLRLHETSVYIYDCQIALADDDKDTALRAITLAIWHWEQQ